MIQTLLTTIDCIRFAKLSLYSVNMAPVCKFCRGCTVKKKRRKEKRENIYIGSVFTVHEKAVNRCDCFESSKDWTWSIRIELNGRRHSIFSVSCYIVFSLQKTPCFCCVCCFFFLFFFRICNRSFKCVLTSGWGCRIPSRCELLQSSTNDKVRQVLTENWKTHRSIVLHCLSGLSVKHFVIVGTPIGSILPSENRLQSQICSFQEHAGNVQGLNGLVFTHKMAW